MDIFMGYRILIAEDDEDIVELLRLYLENEKMEVRAAGNGIDALAIIETERIDLAVLDIMMPGLNGYELTGKIREKSNIPIIILSAKNQDSDKILGLNLGADDYLAKPFNPLEIIARIHAGLRRFYSLNEKTQEQSSKIITVGELTIDTEEMKICKNGNEISLTPTEFKIILMLMKAPGRVYTKVQIYESINGQYFESDDNTMMVHMSNLREKIESDPRNPEYIKTIRGLGYKIEKR